MLWLASSCQKLLSSTGSSIFGARPLTRQKERWEKDSIAGNRWGCCPEAINFLERRDSGHSDRLWVLKVLQVVLHSQTISWTYLSYLELLHTQWPRSLRTLWADSVLLIEGTTSRTAWTAQAVLIDCCQHHNRKTLNSCGCQIKPWNDELLVQWSVSMAQSHDHLSINTTLTIQTLAESDHFFELKWSAWGLYCMLRYNRHSTNKLENYFWLCIRRWMASGFWGHERTTAWHNAVVRCSGLVNKVIGIVWLAVFDCIDSTN